jgi:hypothetical protein
MSSGSEARLPNRMGLRCHHVYRGSRPRLPAREGSDAPCVLWLKILPTFWEDSGATTRSVAPCGLHALNIKKSLAGLHMQLGSHVPYAHTHVSKAHDVRTIMSLQDVRAGSTLMPVRRVDRWLQWSTGAVDH